MIRDSKQLVLSLAKVIETSAAGRKPPQATPIGLSPFFRVLTVLNNRS